MRCAAKPFSGNPTGGNSSSVPAGTADGWTGIRNRNRFIEFLFERADHLDYLFITFQTLLEMKRKNGLEFPGISEPAADLLGRRKLWDFMEDIPDDEDPRAATADLLLELAEHARGPAGGL